MYLNELQARAYFQHERSLDRSLEKSRLARESKATVMSTRSSRALRRLAKRR